MTLHATWGVIQISRYGYFHGPGLEMKKNNCFSICCSSILSLVQFLFSFVSYSLSYISIKREQRKVKIEPRMKLNYNI